MKISDLIPPANLLARFERLPLLLLPASPGCYVIANFNKEIMYVGQSDNIRRRLAEEHLFDKRIAGKTILGVAFYAAVLLEVEHKLDALETGWINEYRIRHGKLPLLNRISPPSP